MLKNKKVLMIVLGLMVVVAVMLVVFRGKPKTDTNEIVETTQDTVITNDTELTSSSEQEEKLIPNETLCSQITKEFVTKVTSVPIARTGTINDFSITACDYYLTNETNSPYIAIILNKNLSVEIQKSFVLKQKLTISTDPRITTDHYIVKSPAEDRIVNINLVLDPKNFIRIDKNVERAIDNEGLLNLAIALSERLD
jgi:hypothetical protein